MGNLQGQARRIATSGKLKVLLFSFALTATFLTIHQQYVNNPRKKSLQLIDEQHISKNSELSQFIVRKKTLENMHKVQQIQTVTSKVKVPSDIDASLLRSSDLPPLTEYWAKILHFVPKVDNQNCLNLFTTEYSKSIAVTTEWAETWKAAKISKYSRRYVPQHNKLIMSYQELARQDFVKTICEIGFNVGQSAIAWLTAKPGIKYYGFDMGVGGLPQKMGKELQKLFPGNFSLTIGDSTKTVPIWIREGVKCDIVSVDGGHSYPIVIQDLQNMKKVASKEHIIVLDDIYYPGVNKAWKEMLNKDVIHHLFDCWLPGIDVDFALGYYKTKDYSNYH